MIAFDLKELFEARGADVHIASSPNDALSLADALVVSAAVIDFGSSGHENNELCRTLHAYGIPFMYYTGYDDVEDQGWGAPVITKPASAEMLIETLAQLRLPQRAGSQNHRVQPSDAP